MHEGGQRQLSFTDQGTHVFAGNWTKTDCQLSAVAAARIQHCERQWLLAGKECDRLANPALMHHRTPIEAARSTKAHSECWRHRRDAR